MSDKCLICKELDKIYKPDVDKNFVCSRCTIRYSNMDEEDILKLFPVTDEETALGFKILRKIDLAILAKCPYCSNPFTEQFTHSTCGLE